MVDHVAPHVENPVSDDFAYSHWAEANTVCAAALTMTLENNRVLMLHPAEQPVL